MKCDEVWNITNAIKKIDKSISDSGFGTGKKCACKRRGYQYFVIETAENAKAKSDLAFLTTKLLEAYAKASSPKDL